MSAEDAKAAMAGHQDDARNWARNVRIGRLHDAGFSDDRIAWLEQRAEEVSKQKDEHWKRRAEEGWPAGPSERAVYMFDKDLDLENEIGEDEYSQYRHGLGRTTGVAVIDVGNGTAGQSYGFMPGDEVVRYDGTRVYSPAMLLYRMESEKPGELVVVEVRRQGRTIQLSLPSGPLQNAGIHIESPTAAIDRAHREAFPPRRK